MTLGQIACGIVALAVMAWFWRAHGIREHALRSVKNYCSREGVEWLDGNVAFKRWRRVADRQGRKRWAREYGFEFTVTGEQRHRGQILMFGHYAGAIELEAHPYPQTETPLSPPISHEANVIELARYRPSDKH